MKNRKFTILVVEDDLNDQALIKMAFAKIGVSAPIHFAQHGGEAIAYMKGEGEFADREKYQYPTFIITDLKMPVLDGFAVLEHLKNNPMWRSIPAVVFSASHDLDDIKKSYMLGASSYHLKPNDFEELRRQIGLLYQYWMTCEIPQSDVSGKQLKTDSQGKLGARFPQPA